PGATVRVNVPFCGTVTASGSLPLRAPAGTTVSVAVPVDEPKEGEVGGNMADSDSVPAAVNVVDVVATPLALTATGAPMFVPFAWNWTDPAGWELSAAISVAVRVAGWPAVAGVGDATSDVVVLVTVGPVALV